MTEHNKFTAVKVFSATTPGAREIIGERVTAWLRENAHLRVVDKFIRQSSDKAHHCLTIVLTYKQWATRCDESSHGQGVCVCFEKGEES